MTVRVLLADDHPVVREGLRALIATTGDMEVVAEAGDGREAIRLARQHAPHAIVMDLSMPQLDGAAAAREILAVRPGTGIVILTMHTDDEALAAALQSGATGFVAKDSMGRDVLDAIRAVAAGKAYFAAAVAARVLHLAAAGVRGTATEALPGLTAREREILTLVARDLDNHAIARKLVLSPMTVRNHLTSILAKLGVTDRQAAAEVARRAGINTPGVPRPNAQGCQAPDGRSHRTGQQPPGLRSPSRRQSSSRSRYLTLPGTDGARQLTRPRWSGRAEWKGQVRSSVDPQPALRAPDRRRH